MSDTGHWEIWIDDVDGELAMDKTDMARRKIAIVEAAAYEELLEMLREARSTVVTHAMQTYSKTSWSLADRIDIALENSPSTAKEEKK